MSFVSSSLAHFCVSSNSLFFLPQTYHATCHSEASAAKLASRLRLNDSARPSRENTPTSKVIPLPTPIVQSPATSSASVLEGVGGSGKKRKADENEDEGNKRMKEEEEEEEEDEVYQVKKEE